MVTTFQKKEKLKIKKTKAILVIELTKKLNEIRSLVGSVQYFWGNLSQTHRIKENPYENFWKRQTQTEHGRRKNKRHST